MTSWRRVGGVVCLVGVLGVGVVVGAAIEHRRARTPTVSRTQPSHRSALRSIDWANEPVPGSACGGTGAVPVHDRIGIVSSQRWPDAWLGTSPSVVPGQVEVTVDSASVTFGDLDGDGNEEAVVAVWCKNGGGTAGGQLGQSLVVFATRSGAPAVLEVLHTTQPSMSYFDSSSVVIERDRISATELFHGRNEPACCPTGRAAVEWRYFGDGPPTVLATVTVHPRTTSGS